MGTLYIIPTPIGNLEDITLRALRILREVMLIAAEDTRTSRVLTRHYKIDTPMTSYHDHNKAAKFEQILAALETGDVALISDAGTPGLSDPGYVLIRHAIERGYPVVPLPGANAITTALVGSGLATDRFLFIGFLPRKPAALDELLQELADRRETIIAFESPYRLSSTLEAIASVMGAERQICVAREISKRFEEFFRGSAEAALERFSRENPRGEVTLLIAGADPADSIWSESQVASALRERLATGESRSRAAKAVAKASGWSKSAVYAAGVEDDS